MTSPRSFSRRSFLKGLGATALAAPFVTRGLMAQSPNSVLRHASFGASGMAWSDLGEFGRLKAFELVAVAEVDLNRTVELKKQFPQARIYQDWRELLDREARHIDSVNVSTPDHMHAVMGMSAMQLGKHVYGQKPLAHDLFEVRKLTEFAAKKKLVTQMGIQIHATSHYQLATILIQAGAVGRIKEIHSWCPKSWGDPNPRPDRTDPVPPGFDWDLWLGTCAQRPFLGSAYYHPANWRKRLDFGTGTFGDMGCHIFDPVFDSLGLGAPMSVRSEGPAPNKWNWAMDSRIQYVFPGTRFTADTTLPVTWYDGEQKPPADVLALLEGDERPNTGSIFVGTLGTLVLPHINRPLLYPDKKFKNFKYPEITSGNHWGDFVAACLGHGRTAANFGYAGPLTEAVLLGGVASRFPQTTIKWDASRLEFDLREANQFVRREYRAGWGVKELSWS
ncbi:MAG TPA: Gfo/Idh/MocA family oxidoreductase [Candidatus Binatia bacterium]|nr:Gfo/Idh/MocA family oxidoreductase [Candidatus Binatia bacterium]